MVNTIKLNETDQFIYHRCIAPFLPRRLFDAHAHLLINTFHPRLAETLPLAQTPGLNNIDLPTLEAWWQTLLPQREITGHVMGFPSRDCDVQAENDYLARTLPHTSHRFSLLVHPSMAQTALEAAIKASRPAGLKPYYVYTPLADPAQARITDYLPEEQIELAHKYKLAVVLHLAKDRGLADQTNLQDITRLSQEYPGCQFILAHCGRCFISINMEDALQGLPRAHNIWLDTSAVCDTGVFLHLLNSYDRKKILFGTDLVTAMAFRGTVVRQGLSWNNCTAELMARTGGIEVKATYAVYENLTALLEAARFCKLTDTERQDIFYNNAARLFQLER